MTQVSEGSAAAPALSLPRLALDYTLTPADALAWECRKRDLSTGEKYTLFFFLACGGGAYAAFEEHLPRWFAALPSVLQFASIAALFWGLWTLGFNLALRRRARKRLPAARPGRFEDRGASLHVTEGTDSREIAKRDVLAVTLAEHHIWIATADGPVILPLSAFADRAEARTWSEAWQAEVDLLDDSG